MFILLTFLYFSRFTAPASSLALLPDDGSLDILASCTGPDQRSVWDIAWSCAATIFACSWVSVHPNIPEPDEALWNITLRRAELMFWSIFAPELVIFWAVRQWDGARRLERKFRHMNWTVTHGHFIQMGGFMLFEDGVSQGTLSPDRFEMLLQDGRIQFPVITREEIRDRSKGDALSKGLVVVQTTWFIIQCIARKAERLDITQMELLTLALAALNIVTYFLWWDKPLDVRCPIPVHTLKVPINPIQLEAPAVTETSWILYIKIGWDEFRDTVGSMGAEVIHAASQPFMMLQDKPWSIFLYIILFLWPFSALLGIFHRLGDFMRSERFMNDDQQKRIPSFYAYPPTPPRLRRIDFFPPVLGAVFGAIHCIGWNYAFPTHIETLLWRVCSVLVATVPGLFFTTFGLERIFEGLPDESHWWWFIRPFSILLVFTLPVYFIARLGLLAEAVISLRALPPKAFQSTEWISFIPHI